MIECAVLSESDGGPLLTLIKSKPCLSLMDILPYAHRAVVFISSLTWREGTCDFYGQRDANVPDRNTTTEYIRDDLNWLTFQSAQLKILSIPLTHKLLGSLIEYLQKVVETRVYCAEAHSFQPAPRAEQEQWAELKKRYEELRKRAQDELELCMFSSISPKQAEILLEKEPFGSAALKFPSAKTDMENAQKALALQMPVSAVFHLMRVLEYALKSILTVIKEPMPANYQQCTWGSLLKNTITPKCDALKASGDPEYRAMEGHLRAARSHLASIQTTWRDPTMHVEHTYTDREAMEVWIATCGFMREFARHFDQKGGFTL